MAMQIWNHMPLYYFSFDDESKSVTGILFQCHPQTLISFSQFRITFRCLQTKCSARGHLKREFFNLKSSDRMKYWNIERNPQSFKAFSFAGLCGNAFGYPPLNQVSHLNRSGSDRYGYPGVGQRRKKCDETVGACHKSQIQKTPISPTKSCEKETNHGVDTVHFKLVGCGFRGSNIYCDLTGASSQRLFAHTNRQWR